MNCSPFSQSSSPTANETSFNKYTLPHLPLRPHTHSYNFYFYGPRPTPTFTVVAAVKQRWMIKVKKKRQVSAASNAYGNQIQSTQTTLHKYKQNNVLLSNDMIRGYVRNGFCKEALRMYYQMQRAGIEPDKLAFISVINACGSLTDLQAGIKVHEDVIGSGYESDIFVGTALSSMYVKCGDLENARQVFDGMPERDVVSWNAIISGCSQNGHHHEALAFFSEMQAQGIKPNSITMVSVLPACTHLVALEQGKQIHGYVIRSGFESDTVGNALVDMYSKCGHINIAHRLFERMSKRNVVSWNEIIAGYSQNGQPYETFAFFDEMRVQGVKPNSITIVSVLTACSDLLALDQGKETHCYAIKSGFESDVVVINALVDMYAKCGTVNIAHNVFERMVQRNVVSWNVIITCDSQNGHLHEALASLNEMQVQGIKPNSITMTNVLPVCAHLLALEQGKQIHGFVIRNGFDSDVVVGTGLVDMYAKCGSVNIAHSLFERMPKRNVVSWNAIISGYSQNGYPHEALALFNEMQVQGIKPNSVTVASVLPACSDLLAMEQGKQIHGYAIRRGFEYDVVVGTGLVDMYAKCGNVNIAHKLFKRMPKKNVVSWNAMIAGYFQNGHPHEALAFFNEMQVQGIKGNLFTMVSILSACADSLTLEQGKQSHGYAIRSGFDSDVAVATVLVDMYAKCGNVNIAHKLFERMPKRNAVSWNAIIAAYSQNGHPHEALAFFREMQVQGIRPDSITMITVLPVCADLLAVEQGKQFHGCVLRNGFESDVVVDTVLINMYAKCGHIDTAQRVFEKMSSRDVVAWNAMILGYGIHGHVEDALALFSRMQQMGTKPDHITFTGVLTACSHAGLVEEGWQYFESMKSDYGLAPKLEHYSCLVDLLGRAGHLDEAYDIIKKMPLEPHAVVWGSLLGACRIHCNIELGEEAAKHLFELEPDNAGCYVLLSNIYAEAGRWEDVAKLRTIMKEREVKKQPGYSFIEVNRKVHTFLVGDRSHPQSEKIYTMLETLYRQMKEAGYVCQTNLVLQDVEEEVKENVLCSHSEKLAISFGIINTSPGTPIHIMKNLRVCSDCHNATKFISKIVRREIISLMHKRTLKPLEEMLPACSRPMMEQSGLKQPPPPDQPLKFPRCDSANTNFCYYNNYSLSQPRHFCKTCKRYWTRGGTLHNVPVGGGCRKNKRANRTIDHACAQMNEASTSVNELNINGSAPLGRSQNANSMFYGLPAGSATTHDGIHSLSLATRLADQRALYGNDSEFLRTFFDPRSCILSPLNWLSSLNALNSFKPTFTCLNFNTNPNRTEALTRAVRDIDASFFESLSTQISEVPLPVLNSTNCDDLSPYSLSLQEGINNGNTNRYSEANQWRAIEQQKLAEGSDPVQVGLTPFSELENSNNSRNDLNLKVVTSLPSCVKVEGQDNRLNITPEWPVPSEPLFEAASDSAYWNGGVWPELTNYGSSVGSLI